MIPVVGDAVGKGGKLALKHGDDIADAAKGAGKIINDVLDSPRVGSALKVDKYHNFNNIIDNYAGFSDKINLGNATLYQLEGSLNGVGGRFEWIIQDGKVTHRMFVKDGILNGVPIK